MGIKIKPQDAIAIGKRLKAARKTLNITQEQLAEKFDISPQALQKIERGANNITSAQLKLLKEEYNLSSDFLLNGNVSNSTECESFIECMSPEEQVNLLFRLIIIKCKVENIDYKKVFELGVNEYSEVKEGHDSDGDLDE